MSASGPESITTTSDRQSKRPTKKRALTPSSSQAASVDALFAKPDQDIRIPTGPVAKRLAPPPEIVTNVQGSSAGAGSGEFHVYKASRRREYERLRLMDEEVRKEQAVANFDVAKRERESKDDEKTRKNREKREKKMKARNKAKTDGGVAGKTGLQRGRQDTDDGQDDAPARTEKETPGAATSKGAPDTVVAHVGLVIHDDD